MIITSIQVKHTNAKNAKKLRKRVCLESLEYTVLQFKKTLDVCIRLNEEIALDSNNMQGTGFKHHRSW